MQPIELSPEERAALKQLLSTAQNKGKKSDWWARLAAPLAGLKERL